MAKGSINVPGVTRAELEKHKKEVEEALENAGSSDVDLSGYVKKTGEVMEGALVAHNNENYTVKQVRNVIIIQQDDPMPDGANGDLCFAYKP